MSLYRSFGSGWVPDVPDHRDHGFEKKPTVEAGVDLLEKLLKESGQPEFPAKLRVAKKIAFGRDRNLLLPDAREPLQRVDLRPLMSPITNQGPLKSCTTHAVSALLEYLQIAMRGEYVQGSRRFLYKVSRDLLQWQGDQGGYIRSTIKAARLLGVCPERYWPYGTGNFDVEPSAFCYSFASNYKAMGYRRLVSLEEVKKTLTRGFPVAFGFTTYESMYTRATAVSGLIPYPSRFEKVIGGHSVVAVGYYNKGSGLSAGRRNYEPNDQDYLIIRNSWGTGWGQGGYGFLPCKYIPGKDGGAEPLADDFWTIDRLEIQSGAESSIAPFLRKFGEHADATPRVTFKGGQPIFHIDQMTWPSLPLDEGESGNWSYGGPVDGGGGGGHVDRRGGGAPVDGDDEGAGQGGPVDW